MAEEKKPEVKEEKKKAVKTGKKKHKNKPTSEKWKKYKISGDKLTREKYCPRCGPGVFMADMKGRAYCGRCGYTEFSK